MDFGAEVSFKIKAAIKAKLKEMDCYVDDELPDYVLVMLANKKSKDNIVEDLKLFLGDKTEPFTDWIHFLLNRLQNLDDTVPLEEMVDIMPDASRRSQFRPTKGSTTSQTQHNGRQTNTGATARSVATLEPNTILDSREGLRQRKDRVKQRSATPPDLLRLNFGGTGEGHMDEFEVENMEVDENRHSRSPLHHRHNAERRGRKYYLKHRSNSLSDDSATNEGAYVHPDRRVESVIQVPQGYRNNQQQKGKIISTAQDEHGMKKNAQNALNGLKSNNRSFVPYRTGDATCTVRIRDRLGSREASPEENNSDNLNSRVTIIRRLDRGQERHVEVSSSPARFVVDDDTELEDPDDESYAFLEDVPNHQSSADGYMPTMMKRDCSWANQCAGPPIFNEDSSNVSMAPPKLLRCQYWPSCKRGDQCHFVHPNTPCKAFPSCPYGAKCHYIHPNCRYDQLCQDRTCPFTHSNTFSANVTRKPLFRPPRPKVFRLKNVAPAASMKYVNPDILPRTNNENIGVVRSSAVAKVTALLNTAQIAAQSTPTLYASGRKMCRHGLQCTGLRNGKCRFFHPINNKKWVAKELRPALGEAPNGNENQNQDPPKEPGDSPME